MPSSSLSYDNGPKLLSFRRAERHEIELLYKYICETAIPKMEKVSCLVLEKIPPAHRFPIEISPVIQSDIHTRSVKTGYFNNKSLQFTKANFTRKAYQK